VSDPIDEATQVLEQLIEMHLDVTVYRHADPTSFPILRGTDVTAAGFARRAVGRLLEAGWAPPPARVEAIRGKA